ncbi:hypothetical protein T5B8_14310 [Salinisphaera sp. T5B8]|uniref:toxin-antitoxin system HicB family antitoxin n=1 Tax=Salinisphaera sp. T5B8 TaxID=1304154 RepID=UPI0033413670
MFDAALYTINVRKGEFDGEICFEATVRELPDVAEYGDSYDEAYELALDTINTTYEALSEHGRRMPEPDASRQSFSGRVTLRLPKKLHRMIYIEAESEGVSLNQQIVNILTFWSGMTTRAVALHDFSGGWQKQVHTLPQTEDKKRPSHIRVVTRNNYEDLESNRVAC